MSATASVQSKTPVVVLTGASGALGSAIATAYAEHGAILVLQDIPEAKTQLDNLAQSLRDQYKVTISVSYLNIRTDAPALINFALQTFGYVTILINNAGFLRDSSFTKLNDQQWNDIIDIHLTVPFQLTKAVWPVFLKQNFGRVLFVSSHAGLFGNFGQSNYSAAKSAILGLTKTLSLEGKKNNIIVNALVPFAQSAMTKSAFPAEMLTNFQPREVAPVVVFLTAHQNTTTTGEVIQCGGGFVSKTVIYTPGGFVFQGGDATTTPLSVKLSQIQQNWPKLDQLPSVPEPTNESDGKGVFSKGAEPVFGEIMRMVQNKVDSTPATPATTTTTTTTAATNPALAPSPPPTPSPPQPSTPTQSGPGRATGLKADILINGLVPHIDQDIIKNAGVVIGFEISPGGPVARTKGSPAAPPAASQTPKRTVTIDLKNGNGGVVWDKLTGLDGKKPDAVLVIHDELLVKLFIQEVEAQSLYLTGKMKLRGDIAKAMKFEQVLKSFEHKVNVKDLLGSSAKL